MSGSQPIPCPDACEEKVLADRHLEWEGCFNVRDLGGIPVLGGGMIRPGAVVRSDSPERLTPVGWAAMVAHGVRTVIDLRNDQERQGDLWARPMELTTVHVPLDDAGDTEFWTYLWDNELDGSPLYYRPFLERKAQQCAAVIAAVARAGAEEHHDPRRPHRRAERTGCGGSSAGGGAR